MRINQELKNNIIIDLNDNLNYKVICDKYKISKNSVYKIKKELEQEYEKESSIEEKESNIEEQEQESNKEDSIDNEIFDIEEFKNELNNNTVIEDEPIIEEEPIIINEPVIIENKPVINNNDLSFISKSSYRSNKSLKSNKSIRSLKNVSFKKKEKKNIIADSFINSKKNENIIDIIKNTECNNGDIDDLKKRRSTIIIIKQYLSTFEEDLKVIFSPNKIMFEKKLFTLNYDQLLTILENIRTTINIKQNKSNFMTLSSNIIKGIEMISNYSGYEVSGLEQQLLHDEDFKIDLQILSCELDISKFINVKSSCLMKIVKTMYSINNEHKMKNQINIVLNDEQKLQELINLDKK